MNFKRYYQENQIVFITQIVKDRQPAFNDPDLVGLLLRAWRRTKERYPFTLLAYVILPDHFHFLIQPKEANFSKIMHALKLSFTNSYKRQIKAEAPFIFWQKRLWDHVIRDERDLENHIHYIHNNPVKHGVVSDLIQWKDSSFHEWLKRGAYQDQGTWVEPEETNWGE